MAAPWMLTGPYTVFDLETTGMSPVHNRIIEIGAVRIEHDGSMSTFQTLIHPETTISYQISRLTGITNEMVKDAPKFTDAAYAFLDFIKGSKLVAHNARFDLGFMQESLARVGLPLLKGGVYDSIVLIRKAYPNLPSYRLQALRTALSLPDDYPGEAHRAGFDAEMTMAAFAMAMKRLYELYPEPDTTL